MKFFSFAFVALAAFTSLVWAMDSATVITDMQTIANLTAQANQMTSELTADNVLSQGPEVIQSLEQITNVVNNDTQAMLATPVVLSDAVAGVIVSLLQLIVALLFVILNTLTGAPIPVLPGIPSQLIGTLSMLEEAFGAFKPALTAIIPTQEDAANAQFALLDPAFQQALSALDS